jgi:hypothetical protein
VPDVPQNLVAAELPDAISALWPKFVSYIISFIVIGMYCWQVHHRTFRYITRYDDRLTAPALTPTLFMRMLVKGLTLPAVCLIGAALSFVSSTASLVAFVHAYYPE